MSLLLLIDGYNVIAPVAGPGRRPDPKWLQRERNQLISRLAKSLPAAVRCRTCVVFDAVDPPRDRAAAYHVDGITVRFAVEHPEADDLLEEIVADHSAPKQLTVVSSDHRIQAAAKRRGAACFDSQSWFDDLLDGKVSLAFDIEAGQGGPRASDKPEIVDHDDVQRWIDDFGL